MRLLSEAFTGDTDAAKMLELTFELLESSTKFMYGDVLWISDFVIPFPEEEKLKKMMDFRKDGTCFYGLQIGAFKHEWNKYFNEIRSIGYIPNKKW